MIEQIIGCCPGTSETSGDAGKSSWQFFRFMLNALPFPVSYITPDRKYVFVNRMYESWFHLNSREIEGKSMLEVLGKDVMTTISPFVDEALEGHIVEFAEELPYKGAENRSIQTNYLPDVGNDGTVCGFVEVMFDRTQREPSREELKSHQQQREELIEQRTGELETANRKLREEVEEQKKALAELRQEKDLWNRLTETSPVGITVVNKHGEITYGNRHTEQVFELTHSELRNRVCNDPEWRITDLDGGSFPEKQLPFSIVRDTLSPIYDVRLAIEGTTGERRFLSINGAPLFTENDEFDGGVFIIRDITGEVISNRLLQASEASFRSVVEYSHSGILIVDDQFRIEYVNDRSTDISGYDWKELINSDCREFLDEKSKSRLTEYMQQRQQGGTPPNQYEATFIDKSGQQRIVEISVNAFCSQEDEFKLVAHIIDITKRKEGEAEQKQLLTELQDALANVKKLEGMIPICAGCKSIRSDEGYWQQVEKYIMDHSEAEFSHGLCPECVGKYYDEFLANSQIKSESDK